MTKLLFAVVLSSVLVFAGCASGGSPAGGVSGTGVGIAPGYLGDVTVALTMRNGTITRVVAEGPGETRGTGTVALSVLSARMVENNTVEVDIISGATWTSAAVLAAASDAMAQIETQVR